MSKKKYHPNHSPKIVKLDTTMRLVRHLSVVGFGGFRSKSLRDSGGLIAESYASIEEGELWLINCYIPLHSNSKTFGHEERRRRKLLINKKQLKKLWVNLTRERMTLIPLKLYLNEKGKLNF